MHTLVYEGGGKGFGNRQTHRGVLRGVIIACERLPVFHMRIKRVSARSRAAPDPAAHVREGNCTSAGAGSGAHSYVNLEGKKKREKWMEAKRQRKQNKTAVQRRRRRWQMKCNPCQRVSGPVCTKAAVLQRVPAFSLVLRGVKAATRKRGKKTTGSRMGLRRQWRTEMEVSSVRYYFGGSSRKST